MSMRFSVAEKRAILSAVDDWDTRHLLGHNYCSGGCTLCDVAEDNEDVARGPFVCDTCPVTAVFGDPCIRTDGACCTGLAGLDLDHVLLSVLLLAEIAGVEVE